MKMLIWRHVQPKTKCIIPEYCLIMWKKNYVKVGSILCNNCAHLVYCSVCNVANGTIRKSIRSDQADQYHIKLSLWWTVITELIGLICDWNSDTFWALPSPMFKKAWYLNLVKFRAWIGTSSEFEITAQAVEARKRKLNEDFTGIQWNGSKFAARTSSSIILFFIIQIQRGKLQGKHWMTDLQP